MSRLENIIVKCHAFAILRTGFEMPLHIYFLLDKGSYRTVRPQGEDRGKPFAMYTETFVAWPTKMRQTIRTFFASGFVVLMLLEAR